MSKRTRYTVTVAHQSSNAVEKRVILAYDAQGAIKHYNSLGYIVLQIEKGDHRRKAKAAAVKASGGYRVDHAALRDACDLLGLTMPVRIRHSSRVGNTRGNYRHGGTYHDIMLKSYLSAEQASSTLWHELTHAMQAERAGSESGWAAVLRDSHGKYQRCPLEREARQMSRTMANVPLCR